VRQVQIIERLLAGVRESGKCAHACRGKLVGSNTTLSMRVRPEPACAHAAAYQAGGQLDFVWHGDAAVSQEAIEPALGVLDDPRLADGPRREFRLARKELRVGTPDTSSRRSPRRAMQSSRR
jgi:hypothetical protein